MIAVYAITEEPPSVAEVETITCGGLSAVYARAAAPPPHTPEAYLAHERVVEAVMAGGATLPLRFASTLDGPGALAELLDREHDRFAALLDAVRGCVELGVRDHEVRPELADLARASARTRTGVAYLVEEATVPAFTAAVRDLEAANPDADPRCSGPWPPYSFVGALPQASPGRRIDTDPEGVEKGLAQLVLTVVELLRQLMERQALHRIDGGGLSDSEVERLGRTLMLLEQRMEELKDTFGLADGDLNLDLGPLGRLL